MCLCLKSVAKLVHVAKFQMGHLSPGGDSVESRVKKKEKQKTSTKSREYSEESVDERWRILKDNFVHQCQGGDSGESLFKSWQKMEKEKFHKMISILLCSGATECPSNPLTPSGE